MKSLYRIPLSDQIVTVIVEYQLERRDLVRQPGVRLRRTAGRDGQLVGAIGHDPYKGD